jgi:hypothetical protein
MRIQLALCVSLCSCGARSELNVETRSEVRRREFAEFQQRCEDAARRVPPADRVAGRYIGYIAETPFVLVNGLAVPDDPEPIYIPEGHELSRINASPYVWSICYLHHLRSPPLLSVPEDWGTCREVVDGLVESPSLGFNIGGLLGPPGSAGAGFTVEAGTVDLRGDCLRYDVTVRLISPGTLFNDGVFISFVGIRQR